jgi:hypothetical protein
MTNLNKLVVSLTKHGAHKAAFLLKAFTPEEVLDNTWGTYNDIHIDRAQTAKNLSVDDSGKVPSVWKRVKTLQSKSINYAVAVAIIMSHHQLIKEMIAGSNGDGTGSIPRINLDSKVYTNLACILQELGLATSETPEKVTYDWNRVIDDNRLSDSIREIIELKLKSAGWDGENFITECLRLKINEVFAINATDFTNWLTDEILRPPVEPPAAPNLPFSFRAGHNQRIEGEIERGGSGIPAKVALLHNEVQNALFKFLVRQYGQENVGTEVATGYGSSAIDLVLRTSESVVFFEIKTYISTKACLRAALGQLVEYAYWPDRINAKRLVIVSQNPATSDTRRYMEHLRNSLNLPVFYQQFDLQNGVLGELF